MLDDQIAAMDHADGAVRWWACIGLLCQDGSDGRVQAAFTRGLGDPSPLVQIESAAGLLGQDAQHATARCVLLEAIRDKDLRLVLRAARAAITTRLHDATFIDAMREAAEVYSARQVRQSLAALERQQEGRD